MSIYQKTGVDRTLTSSAHDVETVRRRRCWRWSNLGLVIILMYGLMRSLALHADPSSEQHLLAEKFALYSSGYQVDCIIEEQSCGAETTLIIRFWSDLKVDLHMEHMPDQDPEAMLSIIKQAMTRQSEALLVGLTEIAERTFTKEDLAALQLPFSEIFRSPETYQSRLSAQKKLPIFHENAAIFVRNWAHSVGRDAFLHDEAFFRERGSPDYRDSVRHGVTK